MDLPLDILANIAKYVFQSNTEDEECSSFPMVCNEFRQAWNDIGAPKFWIRKDILDNFEAHIDKCVVYKDIKSLVFLFEIFLDQEICGYEHQCDIEADYYRIMTRVIACTKSKRCKELRSVISLDHLWNHFDRDYEDVSIEELRREEKRLRKLLVKAEMYEK